MRFMIIRKADAETEAGVMASEELIQAMARYNEELVNAGVMVGGDGLHPSARGARIKFSGGRPTVTDGPFTEAKELVAGYTLIDVASRKRRSSGPAAGRRWTATATWSWRSAASTSWRSWARAKESSATRASASGSPAADAGHVDPGGRRSSCRQGVTREMRDHHPHPGEKPWPNNRPPAPARA